MVSKSLKVGYGLWNWSRLYRVIGFVSIQQAVHLLEANPISLFHSEPWSIIKKHRLYFSNKHYYQYYQNLPEYYFGCPV